MRFTSDYRPVPVAAGIPHDHRIREGNYSLIDLHYVVGINRHNRAAQVSYIWEFRPAGCQ